MFEKDLKMAWNNRRDDWRRDLEARAARAEWVERMNEQVKFDEPGAREIRQALLAMERHKNQTVILWLYAGLVASLFANLFQGLLYMQALKTLCK